MRRKINYKFLLYLLGSVIVLTGALFAVHWFQSRRIARALLWQADRAEERGETERLARYLVRYREFAPDDLLGLVRLGQVWAGDTFAGNAHVRRQAVSLLETALGRDPDRADLRRLLIKAALEIGQLKTARDHLQALLTESGTPRVTMTEAERGTVESFWGQLGEAEKNKQEQAIAWYRAAVGHDPSGQAAYVRLAWLLRAAAKKEIDPEKRKAAESEADKLLDELVARNPETATAYLALALPSRFRPDQFPEDARSHEGRAAGSRRGRRPRTAAFAGGRGGPAGRRRHRAPAVRERPATAPGKPSGGPAPPGTRSRASGPARFAGGP